MNAFRCCQGVALRIVSTLALALPAWGGAALSGQEYEPGPEPDIADIQHRTLLLDPDRTILGIRESIELWVDESTWEDTDIEVDEEGNEIGQVDDRIGEVTWMACPLNGQFLPATGPRTWYYTDYACFDDTEEIWAAVDDKGTYADDFPTYQCLSVEVVVPSGTDPSWFADRVLGTPGPPDKSMGTETRFAIQVLPDSVDFGGIFIREIVEEQTFHWPDGSSYTVPAKDIAVRPGMLLLAGEWQNNTFGDIVNAGGLWDIEHLYNPESESYEDAEFRPVQLLFFQCGPTDFHGFDAAEHRRWFRAESFECEVGWESSGGQATGGTPQTTGPWQNPPAE